ncbi:MAG: aldehyde oxidase [Dethiosulfovibrio peptidovorans]|nr:MAG: aldehyde oxidase [Dethiosulfovibrio peptidovorans]
MTDECKYVGHDVQRNDIVEKCTGRLRYLADRPDGGVVHARHILSSVANGRVISIDPTEALKVPGVIKVYTPADDPGETYNSAIFLPDQVDLRDERVFTDRPIFVGDVIGAVVAETDHAARVAASLVQIQYETYDPVIDMVAALEAPSFREGFPQVLEGCISYGDGPPKNAIHFESTVTTPKIHHSAMENHICQASLEYGDVLLVESPCQMIFTIRYVLSELFHRPINRIRVVKSPMGGTFGAKQEVLLEPACALIAMDLARPVRLSMDRRETIIGTRTRAATRGTVTTFVDKEGNFLHRDIRSITDAGAYTSGGHRVTMAMGKKASRLYTLPSQKFVGKTTFTNTTPNGACRGYGSPQIHTITEIHIDLLARHIGMDPVEIRMKNLVHPGDPDPAGGTPLGNARIRDCLRLGAEAFQWTERRDLSLVTDRYRQGVGLACCTHGNGYYGSPFPDFLSMAMRFCEDGTVLVNASLHELGNGTLTVIGQIVGEILSIDPTMIHVTEGDTQTTPFDVGCVASRVTYVCGPCALDLAEKLRERFIGQISRVLQVEQQSVQMNAGRVIVPELGEWGYGEMVCRIAKELREEVGEYHQYAPRMNPASYGVNFAEVQVDTLTGLIQVTDFLAVHDVGKAINPAMVRGQIYGGIQMGIGMALTEELVYDKQGHPKSDSLSRYHMINAPDMPPIQVMLVEEYEPGGPFGAKSIGEISTVPTAAAVVNAVNRALGTSMTDLPLTPERVLQAIEHTRREE